MKRTAMRRTPPKPTPVYDAYKQQPSLCDEILMFTGVRWLPNGKTQIEHVGLLEPAADVHHIFGRGKYGDVWSNLIAVNKAGHDERHHGTKGREAEFTALCLMAKWAKHHQRLWHFAGTLDWDYDSLRRAAPHNIAVIVESVRFADEFVEVGRKNLLAVLEDLES